MADATNRILWKFLSDTKSLDAGNKRAQKGFKKTTKATSGLTKAAKGLGVAFGAGQVVRALGSAIGRAEEMNSLYAITEQVIQQTGNAAAITADEVKDMASAMATTTGIDKSVATEAANILLTFKNLKSGVGDTNGVFERTHALTADMATVMGGSATDAAKQLGKALNDPVTGLGGLSRAGVQFTKDQKKVIASLVETGDVAGAQELVLEELEGQLGGTAVAAADATEIMARSFDEVTEAVGQELLPAIEAIAPAVVDTLKTATKAFADFGDEVNNTARLVADAVDDERSAWDRVASGREAAADVLSTQLGVVDTYLSKVPILNRVNLELEQKWDDVNGAVFGVTERYDELIAALASRYPPAANAVTGANAEIGLSFDEMKAKAEEAGFALLTAIGLGNFTPKGPTGLPIPIGPTQGLQEGFHTGGVVPGPVGSPQPILAKGGERVVTRGHGGNGGIVINVEAGIGDPVAIAEQVRDLLELYDRTNGSFN